jgi:SAM-dependent methyltransferase
MLVLVKIKHKLQGYASPKPFSVSEVVRCIDYDLHTVEEWLSYLAEYTGMSDYLRGRRVLELGPGSDLGVGLILLSEGARQYSAVDANNLVASVPADFYTHLFQRLQSKVDVKTLEAELDMLNRGEPARLNYVSRDDFDLVAALDDKRVDIIFSQAAFEHFEDINKTIEQITSVASEDAVVVITVDLQTHSRWIRQKDPNNIYRYPAWLYRLFHFTGIPNRVRPHEYQAAFERNGWTAISIRPLTVLPEERLRAIQPHLYGPYCNKQSDMEYLTMLLCARRSVSSQSLS